jgi:hypothetical protein
MTTRRFARTTSKTDKPARRTSDIDQIPISIRSSISLDPSFEDRIRRQLGSRVRHRAGLIERGTVRFEDANGPKGGVDTICRIKLVVRGRPSVVTEKRDTSVGRAFAQAVHAVGIAVGRNRDKRVLRSTRRISARAPQARSAALEDSRTRPSRRSTRRSANRSKPCGSLAPAGAAAAPIPRKRAPALARQNRE